MDTVAVTDEPTRPEPSSAAGAGAEPTRPRDGSPGNVLVVDDDEAFGRSLLYALELRGYRAVYAGSPVEADRQLAAAAFDLVVSDVFMPGNDRLEWVERLLAHQPGPAVILVTGSPDLETACRAANLAVDGYLLKPVDHAQFHAKVGQVLRNRRESSEFHAVAGRVLELLSARGVGGTDEERLLLDRLAQMARAFGTRGGSTEESWRRAIDDTIRVIDQTRHSFKSRELGFHRKRLTQFLQDGRY